MKLVAPRHAPIDPNDVPLSTLIEQNNDPVYVNFVLRNNLIIMLIGTILILGCILKVLQIIMVIPMVILIIIMLAYPLILRVI